MNKVLGTTLAMVLACGGGCSRVATPAATTTTPDYSYAGAGSKWGATMKGDGTFSMTHAASATAAVDTTITGTYLRNATGFLSLTVTGGTGDNAPTAGETAFGLEVPGFALLIKPAGGDSNLIPMVASGTCPTADFDANWLMVKRNSGTAADNQPSNATIDWYGTFNYATATGIASIPTKYNLTDAIGAITSLGSNGLPGATCSDGIMTVGTGDSTATMYLTNAGAALVHMIGSDGIIFGFPKSTITTASSLAASYAGLVFDSGASSGSRIFPVSVAVTESGGTLTGTATKLTDVVAGTTDAAQVTLSLTNMDTPTAGFMRGTVTMGGQSGAMACVAVKDAASSGKNLISCVAAKPGDATSYFNVLMRSI